jgi:hypothetical protein
MRDQKLFKHSIYSRASNFNNQAGIIWNPKVKDWIDVIEDYIVVAKKRKLNKLAMAKLQMNIFQDIASVSEAISHYRELIKQQSKLINDGQMGSSTIEDVDYWKSELTRYSLVKRALFDIGDGIAWRLYNYDRAILYNMCANNTSPGPISYDEGRLNELVAFGDFITNKSIAQVVYHGLTNFLLIGDITTLDNSGGIEIIEVKSNKHPHGKSWKKRIERQVERQGNIIKLANTGEGISSGKEVSILTIESKPITKLKLIKNLLRKASPQLFVKEILYDYLSYYIFNWEYSQNSAPHESINDIIEKISNIKSTDTIITYDGIRHSDFTPNIAPLSIHKYCSQDIASLLMGKYYMRIDFNQDKFCQAFTQKGYKVNFNRDEIPENAIFLIQKGRLSLSIPPYLFTRIIYEGYSIDNIIAIFQMIERERPANSFLFFEHNFENTLWD